MKVGDAVTDGAVKGRVVVNLTTNEFSPEYPSDKWGYLECGVLVETAEAGVVHYENIDALTLLTRL